MILNNFFTKIGLFISNNSLGKYPEGNINILLRYLLLINSINKKLNKNIKFVNKKYKENKKERIDIINYLEKNNKELNIKRNKLENDIKKYEETLEIYEKNKDFQKEKISIENYIFEDVLPFENQKNKNTKNDNKEIVNNIIHNENSLNNKHNNLMTNNILNENINGKAFEVKINNNSQKEDKEIENNEGKIYNNKNVIKISNKNIENNKNESKLSHEVVIEYEDGIDQNVEINYEDDDMSNEYNYEKENEMIKKGINPYNNKNINTNKEENIFSNLQNDIKEISIINKQSSKSSKNNTSHKILSDTEESDKNLTNLLYVNNDESKNNNLIKNAKNCEKNNIIENNKNKENIDFLNISNNNNKKVLEIEENRDKNKINENDQNNKNEKNKKIKKIKDGFEININNLRKNNNMNHHKVIEIKENKENNSLNSNIRKINDYTFNISINNSNKNIFTENIQNNYENNNIKNLKTKTIYNSKNKIKAKNVNENNNIIINKIYLNNNKDKFQLAKKIQYKNNIADNNNNDKEEIITYKISSLTKNELQGISKNKNDLNDIIKNIEIDNCNYNNRIKRIINSKDTNSKISISKNDISEKNSCLTISPIKKEKYRTMNKFERKNNLNGRKNHNYISIINITNNSPIEQKKEEKIKKTNAYDEQKIYIKKNRGNFKTKKLLEENFEKSNPKEGKNNEYNIDENFEIFDKYEKKLDEGNNYILKNNDENNKDITEPIKTSKNIKKIDLSQYLNDNKSNNIKVNGNKTNNNKNNFIIPKNNDFTINIKKQDINNTPPKNNEHYLNKKLYNDFFNNINATTLKITKSREININEIKNSKKNIISKRNFSKTITKKNLNDLIIKDLKNSISLNRENIFSKENKSIKNITLNSFKTNKNKKKLDSINNDKLYAVSSNRHNSYNNLKIISKNRENSLDNETKKEKRNLKFKLYRSKNKKINISSNNKTKKNEIKKINLKNIISPKKIKKLKIINIPIGKKKNKRHDYNSNTYDANSNRKKYLRVHNNINNKIFFDYSNINENNENNFNSNTINESFFLFNNKDFYDLDNKINILTNKSRKIFCYYRLYNQKNIELNLLENSPKNFEIFGFSEGYIFLNFKLNIFKLINKTNDKIEINNQISNITEIEIEPYMINILKIHLIYEKINENKNCQTLDFNNLLNKEEITRIPMEQNEKIKAALCNNFSFNLIFNDLYERKIECIINSFDIYLFLIKLFDSILEYKNKDNYDKIKSI